MQNLKKEEPGMRNHGLHPFVEMLFPRPVQTIKGISLVTGISRITIWKAIERGEFRGAYRSGDIWLIDTADQKFLRWLAAHPERRRSVNAVSQMTEDTGKAGQESESLSYEVRC